MSWEAWVTLAATAAMVIAMARGLAGPDIVMLTGLGALVTLRVLPVERSIAGFANEGVLTVAVLFVVAAGVRDTGGLDAVLRRILGRPRSLAEAQGRMFLPVAAVSAFLNNTPVMAMMMPVVVDWARRNRLTSSRLLIPLSYAVVLGGTCTLVGTSTNLVVYGLARGERPGLEIGLFDLAILGLPTLLAGLAYVLVASRRLLPDRASSHQLIANPREYTVSMRVEEGSVVVGQRIEEAGLRHLPGLYLVELERDGELMPAVDPDTRLRAGDHLLFVGVIESVVDLRRVRGLVPATDQVDKLSQPRPLRRLLEAVVGAGSTLVGKNVRELRFRTQYEAAIIAVHRNGERVSGKVGDIVLRTGDVLLLEAPPAFLERHRNDSDFALVTEVEGSSPLAHDKAPLALGLLLAMILLGATGLMPLIVAGLLAAAAMIVTGCLSPQEARRAVDMRTLLAVAASFGISAALESTGAARAIGGGLVELAAPFGPMGTLIGIYAATACLTQFVTNNAAAALVYPLASAAGASAGLPLHAVALVVMMAASSSFSTPIAYQTNLMVYGPGGYRFGDFVRFGLPLQLVTGATTLAMARWFLL